MYAPSGFYIASGGKINNCSVNQQPYIILTLKIISLTWLTWTLKLVWIIKSFFKKEKNHINKRMSEWVVPQFLWVVLEYLLLFLLTLMTSTFAGDRWHCNTLCTMVHVGLTKMILVPGCFGLPVEVHLTKILCSWELKPMSYLTGLISKKTFLKIWLNPGEKT